MGREYRKSKERHGEIACDNADGHTYRKRRHTQLRRGIHIQTRLRQTQREGDMDRNTIYDIERVTYIYIYI